MLIEAGADVDAGGVGGSTTLMHAASNGSHACARMLLEAGADVNVKDEGGHTALMYAATGNLILDMPCDVRLPPNRHEIFSDWHGYCEIECHLPSATARIIDVYVTEESTLDVVSKGTDECLRLLLAAGADVNAKDNTGATALIRAVAIPNVKCLDLLIRAGADVNAADNKGVTALINVASLHGLKFFLKQEPHRRKGCADAKEQQICADALACVKMLVKAGACDPDSEGNALAALKANCNSTPEKLKPFLHEISEALSAAGELKGNSTGSSEDQNEAETGCDPNNNSSSDNMKEMEKDEEKDTKKGEKENVTEHKKRTEPEDENKAARKTEENEANSVRSDNTGDDRNCGDSDTRDDSNCDGTDDTNLNSRPIRQRVHIRRFMIKDHKHFSSDFLPQHVPVIDSDILQIAFNNFPGGFDGFNAAMANFMLKKSVREY